MKEFVLPIKLVESEFNIKLKHNKSVLGLDTATKTGYCLAQTDTENITFNVGLFNVDAGGISDRKQRRLLQYQYIYDNLESLFKEKYVTVIENVYFGNNADVLILLARIGGIAYAIARSKGVKKEDILWYTAGEARKELGLKGNAKKEIIFEEVTQRLDLSIKSHDEVDALILALCGLKQ